MLSVFLAPKRDVAELGVKVLLPHISLNSVVYAPASATSCISMEFCLSCVVPEFVGFHDPAHTHTLSGIAVSAQEEGLLPISQHSLFPLATLGYHDYEGVALDHSERPRLQKDLGSHNIMLLKNHGTLTVGRTCAEAFMRMYILERACTMQVRTRVLSNTCA